MKQPGFNISELEQREYLSLPETAAVLGVSVGTLTVEIRSGRLQIIRMGQRGRRIVVPKTARHRWSDGSLTGWRSADGA